MTQAIVFVSTCPSCKREQPQDAFSLADLLRLLDGGYPIEAYCVPCDGFWPIGLKERVQLGEAVAAACKSTSPIKGVGLTGSRFRPLREPDEGATFGQRFR
jgi:hypothetical protein